LGDIEDFYKQLELIQSFYTSDYSVKGTEIQKKYAADPEVSIRRKNISTEESAHEKIFDELWHR
jgi:hypothetical protein